MKKNWHLKPKAPQNFLEKFPEYSSLILQLLYNRRITEKKEIEHFFNPDYQKDLINPFLMEGMDKAVKRILKAIREKEKIVVFGDYDVDGITSAAVLAKTLKFLGNEPEIYIPDRAKEGYGLNLEAIKYLEKQKIDLIITVDCGISDFKEITLANQLGIDTIVTDHHSPPEKIPPALTILNPKLKGCSYPFKDLAGVGVAYKLAQALICKSKAENRKPKVDNGFEKWLLDLVALGTIADCVPLLGENRVFVHYGLIVLNKTRNLGLKKLIEVSRISNKSNGNPARRVKDVAGGRNGSPTSNYSIVSEDISFILGPRLNVAGRMDHANLSFHLLMSEDEIEIEKITQKLEKKNQERQKITKEIVEEVKKRFYQKQDKIIFEADSNWPIGLVGLVAGKLSDEFSRPALIFSKGEKKSIGSGRSIPCFNLIEAISHCRDFLLEFGGHIQAAGFTVLNDKLDDFYQCLKFIAERKLKEQDLAPTLEIETEVAGKDLNWEFFNQISKFAPFGQNNPAPLFLMKNLQIKEKRAVGNSEKHLKMKLFCKSSKSSSCHSEPVGSYYNAAGGLVSESEFNDCKEKIFEAICFNFKNYFFKLKENDFIDVVFELISNYWNGFSNLQLKIVDLKKSKKI